MPQAKLKNAYVAIGLAISFSLGICPSKSEANPAMLLAPELCATGIGCAVGAIIIIGGIAYTVQQRNGHKILVPQENSVTYSRAISGIEAAKRGDAHWVASSDPTLCYKMAKKYGRRVKEHPPAQGGGTWCIFHGKQTSLGGGND